MAYHRPCDIEDALALMSRGDMRVIAGGTDVMAATAAPGVTGDTVDITGLDTLKGISQTPSGWAIGAATTWSDIARTDLPPAFKALQMAALQVGGWQIQNAGTIAGNICNASPAADGVPALLVMDAAVELRGENGTRRVPLAEFITGVRQTNLKRAELVTAVHIPANSINGTSVFSKLGARAYLVISVCMVAIRIDVQNGEISDAAIAVGACSPVAARLTGVENYLIGKRLIALDGLAHAVAQDIKQYLAPISDVRADTAYRKHAASELILRCLRGFAERALT